MRRMAAEMWRLRADGVRGGKTWSVMRNVGVQTDPEKEEAQGVSSQDGREANPKPGNHRPGESLLLYRLGHCYYQDGREAKPKPGKTPDGSGDDPKIPPESPSKDEAGKSGMSKKQIAAIAGTAVVVGIGAVVAAPVVLGAAGFGTAGVTGGTWAAWVSATYGGFIPAGGWFAICTSAGAGGAGATTVAAVAGATGAATGAATAAAGAVVHNKMTTGGSTEGGKQEGDGEEEEEEEEDAVEDSPGPGPNKRNKGVQVDMKNRGSRV